MGCSVRSALDWNSVALAYQFSKVSVLFTISSISLCSTQVIQRVIRIRKPVEKPVMPDFDMYKNFNGTDPMANYTWFKEYMNNMANQTGSNATYNETDYMNMYMEMLKNREGGKGFQGFNKSSEEESKGEEEATTDSEEEKDDTEQEEPKTEEGESEGAEDIGQDEL